MTIPTELLADLTLWRQQHPAATFTEIEAEVARRLAQLHAEAVASVVNTPDETLASPTCPACGQRMQASGTRTRTIQTRTGVTVRLTRAYFVCPVCATGIFPPR